VRVERIDIIIIKKELNK